MFYEQVYLKNRTCLGKNGLLTIQLVLTNYIMIQLN